MRLPGVLGDDDDELTRSMGLRMTKKKMIEICYDGRILFDSSYEDDSDGSLMKEI